LSKYRQTMAEAYAQVQVQENDYLKSKLNDTQIANIKQLWMRKTAKDVTPSVKDMIKKMDIPTQLAIKHANINQLSKLVETLDESFSDAQIAVLKKQYEPMRGKTISIDNANKLGQLFTKFDSNKNALEKLYGGNIPFVSTMAMTRLMTKHGYNADQLNKIRKEERFPLDEEKELEILDEATLESVEITEGKIDSKKFDSLKKGDSMTITYQSTMSGTTVKKFVVKNKTRSAKYNTDKVKLEIEGKPGTSPFYLYKRKNGDVSFAQDDMAATVVAVKEQLAEGRMSDIDQMQKDGKSAAEIAKLMKLDVKTVKSILGEVNEEELHEFKKMTVSFNSHADMSKASTDLAKKGFTITGNQKALKIDGNGADLNKYATDLKNFYGATVRAESYSIDESADEDFYDPITEACWVGWTQKGMKKKGDRMVPNCVKEEISEAKEKEDDSEKQPSVKEKTDDSDKLKGDLQKKDAEIAQLKQKSETDKTKAVAKDTKKMVNPETGEPLLQVGIAYKIMRDKVAKEKEKEEV